jgi:hypothetical protein
MPLHLGLLLFCIGSAGLAAAWVLRARTTTAVLLVNLSAVLVAVAAAEYWLASSDIPLPPEQFSDPRFIIADADLGYAPSREARAVRATLSNRAGKSLYDVAYTLDDKGLRVTPMTRDVGPRVFFFGCSFTFGEGVGDHDTMPAQFARLTGQPVSNIGFPGYGPHQFLRTLETKFAARPGDAPIWSVYTLLPDHIDRAAGRSPWETNGPSYLVGQDGMAHFNGQFPSRDAPTTLATRLMHLLPPSLLYRAIESRFAPFRASEGADRERVVAILKTAHRRLAGRLLVVLWDALPAQTPAERERAAWLGDALQKSGIPFLAVSQTHPAMETLHFYIEEDRHPLPIAYFHVAKGLARVLTAPADTAR